jgi:hypothetical protein
MAGKLYPPSEAEIQAAHESYRLVDDTHLLMLGAHMNPKEDQEGNMRR